MKNTRINAYLNFNGNCKEAMQFYHSCLSGELTMQKIAESPMAATMNSQDGNRILHSILVNNHLVLMGSDMMGESLKSGNGISLCIMCKSEDEINHFFNRLAQGGQIKTPLHQTFWGATYGELTDKFGFAWMFNYSKT